MHKYLLQTNIYAIIYHDFDKNIDIQYNNYSTKQHNYPQ